MGKKKRGKNKMKMLMWSEWIFHLYASGKRNIR